ncbi:MAG: hypothetical protein GY759_07770 [Chloroflexi bacterium]|nr:hypothetical protein [Chloroflexota bacterium]
MNASNAGAVDWGDKGNRLRRGYRRWGLLMAILLGMTLVGCGRAPTPTATATATKTVLATATHTSTVETIFESHQPLVMTEQENLATPVVQAQAATPSPTPSPLPTATPTPTATPFPPGPPSKLGLLVGRNDPQIFDLLETGNVSVIKTLEYDANFVAEIKRISPQTLIVARYTPLPLPDLNQWDPIAAARAFVDLLAPIAVEPRRLANIDCWESYNEPVIYNAEQMASYAQFEAERTRLLAEMGIRSCVGSFSTGQPSLELWPAFFPALQAAKTWGGYLSLHEYSAPYMWFASGPHQLTEDGDEGDEGWLTLRYRKVYRNFLAPNGLDIPLVITETGIDGQVGNRPGPEGLGWQDFGRWWREQGGVSTTEEGFYVEQLAWYDAELMKDDYVLGATIYALAGPQGWQSFEIGGLTVNILEQYLAVHPQR